MTTCRYQETAQKGIDLLRGVAAALPVVWVLLVGAPALGLGPEEDKGNWDFDIALYGWLTDVTGEATVGDVTVDVDPQLWNDIIKNLDAALFVGTEARYRNRWILNVDLAASKITSEDEQGPFSAGFGPATFERNLGVRNTTVPVSSPIGDFDVPVRVDGGTLRVDVPRVETLVGPFEIESTLTQVITRGLIGYRALDVPLLGLLGRDVKDDPRRVRFDLLGGIRHYYIKMEIDIEAPPVEIPPFQVTSSISGGSVRVGGSQLPSRTHSLGRIDLGSAQFSGATLGGTDIDEEGSDWWIDPVLGARVGVDVSEKVSLILLGNVGGFGIGSASKFSWETTAFANYQFGENWSFALGYRALGFDREGSDVALDLIEHGAVLGFIYSF